MALKKYSILYFQFSLYLLFNNYSCFFRRTVVLVLIAVPAFTARQIYTYTVHCTALCCTHTVLQTVPYRNMCCTCTTPYPTVIYCTANVTVHCTADSVLNKTIFTQFSHLQIFHIVPTLLQTRSRDNLCLHSYLEKSSSPSFHPDPE